MLITYNKGGNTPTTESGEYVLGVSLTRPSGCHMVYGFQCCSGLTVFVSSPI